MPKKHVVVSNTTFVLSCDAAPNMACSRVCKAGLPRTTRLARRADRLYRPGSGRTSPEKLLEELGARPGADSGVLFGHRHRLAAVIGTLPFCNRGSGVASQDA